MPTTFTFPTSEELSEIAQDKLPALLEARPIFDHFPLVDVDDSVIAWEQKDRYLGLQNLRGINGAPQSIKKTPGKRFLMDPGYYGEFSEIDEQELTRRRQYGTFDQPVDIEDLVLDEQDKLLQRRLDRIEQILWVLATTGTFSVSNQAGTVTHTDTYRIQSFDAITAWSNHANATPLLDFQSVQLLARGHSVVFNSDAVAMMNRSTFIDMVRNINAADLYGRRTTGLGTVNSLGQLNELFLQDDLPRIIVYDNSYLLQDSGGSDDYDTVTVSPQLFIPDNKVVVFGVRPNNVPVGEYKMTRNAQNPGMAPGPYMFVRDGANYGEVPRTVQVHDGHNGGPTVEYPSAVVMMDVS